MKKLLGLFLLGAVGLLIPSLSHASSIPTRSPKEMFTILTTGVTISSVTSFNVGDSSNSITKPGAIYEITLGTGTAGDYLVLYDTNSAVNLVVGSVANPSGNHQVGPRYYYGSTTASTQIQFDPPLNFFNGLIVGLSNSGDQAGITYELGRGLSGQ